MKWTLVAILSVPAFVMGSLSIFGLTQGIELFLWLGFAAGAAGLLAKYLESRLLIHTLLVGLLWGLVNGVLQSLFFPTYLANNPAARNELLEVTFIEPHSFAILAGPIPGILTGFVIYVLTRAMRKFLTQQQRNL